MNVKFVVGCLIAAQLFVSCRQEVVQDEEIVFQADVAEDVETVELAVPDVDPAEKGEDMSEKEEAKGLYALIRTSMGDIKCELFEKEAPLTVENFIGLAEGTKEWLDPETRQTVSKPLYEGTIFHRVIPGFMIQGGDPLGSGMGDPGYRFEDEFSAEHKFDEPGKLAMANSGPNTNGSQFFITVEPTPWLNNRHTIFGSVVEGQDVVDAISKVQRNQQDRPLEPVVLESIKIIR